MEIVCHDPEIPPPPAAYPFGPITEFKIRVMEGRVVCESRLKQNTSPPAPFGIKLIGSNDDHIHNLREGLFLDCQHIDVSPPPDFEPSVIHTQKGKGSGLEGTGYFWIHARTIPSN